MDGDEENSAKEPSQPPAGEASASSPAEPQATADSPTAVPSVEQAASPTPDLKAPPNSSPGTPTVPSVDPIPAGAALRWLFKYLYNSNPFYAISAAFVLLGLHHVFQDEAAVQATTAVDFNSWILLGVIAGYCAVLATTAFLIVRFGKVWDDARTILCTLLLVFVALSVNFDKLALTHPMTFIRVLALGLLFAIGMVEVLLRSLGIRMSLWYRVPLHLFLVLFFLYPMGLAYVLDEIGGHNNRQGYDATLWGILLFPMAAAAVTLSLLPAAIKGESITKANGTPWRWPLFPWSAFVLLGVGALLRSYYLTISFHPRAGLTTAFGPYLVCPFLIAVCAVFFELSRAATNSVRENAVLILSLFLLLFAQRQTGRIGVPYREAFEMYSETLGTPLFTTLLGLIALQTYAWMRGNRVSVAGLILLVAISTFVGPTTERFSDLNQLQHTPLLILSVVFLAWAIWKRSNSLAWLACSAALIGAITILFRDTEFLMYQGMIPINIFLFCAILIGICFRDPFAIWIQNIALWTMFYICFLVAIAGMFEGTIFRALISTSYLLAYTSLVWILFYFQREQHLKALAILLSCLSTGESLVLIVRLMQKMKNPTGPFLLFSGIFSFVVAAVISSRKAKSHRVQQAVPTDPPGPIGGETTSFETLP